MASGRLGSLLGRSGLRSVVGGLIALIVVEGVLGIAGEKRYVLSVTSLIILAAVGGWAIEHYRALFEESMRRLADMTQIGRDGRADEFVEKWDRILFRPFAPGPILLVVSVYVLWALTLRALGPVFNHAWIDLGVYVFFAPVVVVGTWGSFLAVGVVWAIRQTANIGLRAPFSVVRNPVIADMERGWRTAGFFILAVYLLLLAAMAAGPHELDWLLSVWLVAFVLFPIAWFVVGSYQLHRMLLVLKDANLSDARANVRNLAGALANDRTDVTLQEFNAALDIEAKAQAMPAWPSVPGGLAGFVFAIAPLVIQGSLVYAGLAERL